MPEKSGVFDHQAKNQSLGRLFLAQNQGFKGLNPPIQGQPRPKAELFAVEAELYGLDSGAVSLHGNLNYDPGFT